MKCVEFDKMPPEFEICDKTDGLCVIRFYCDVEEFEKEGQELGFRATCFEMETKKAANLYNRIERNKEAWLNQAKQQEKAEETKEQKKNYGARLDSVEVITDDIVLLMAEIIGGEE